MEIYDYLMIATLIVLTISLTGMWTIQIIQEIRFNKQQEQNRKYDEYLRKLIEKEITKQDISEMEELYNGND